MYGNRPQGLRGIPSATGGIARLACARMRELGKDVAAVLSKADLTAAEVDDPAARLEVRTQIRILQLAADELDDDLLGFHLARSFDLRAIGLLYYVMSSSGAVVEALRNAERYSRIVNEGVRLHVRTDGNIVIGVDYVNVNRRSDRHQIEFWLTTLVRICRELTQTRLAPLAFKVTHPNNVVPEEYRAFLGTDAHFDADADEITFPKMMAGLPVIGADNYLNTLLKRYADEALARRPPAGSSVRHDVERVILPLLPHGKATLSEVARRIGLSSRTLSRLLCAEDTTFIGILDELKIALARRYLGDRDLPISEIAWLLGYRETSSFTHAFRRWTGVTPRQFRAAGAPRQTLRS